MSLGEHDGGDASGFDHSERSVDRNRPAPDAFGKRPARHQLHHKKHPVTGLFDAADRCDVG
jgi:hypothetical protein